MAGSNRVRLPEPFQFDNWPKWKHRFQQYRSASGLTTADEEQQVATLLYCMREEAEDVLNSTGISAEDRAVYERVMERMDQFFKVRFNVILERAKFNCHFQKEGKSATEYIAALYNLVETCDYGALKDETIHDQLVVGIRDPTLSEKLQLNVELTLEAAKKEIRLKEAVHNLR